MKLWELVQTRSDELSLRLWQHIQLALGATLIAVVVGVAMGMLAMRRRWLREAVLGLASVVQTVPSLAMLTFLLPFFGIGTTPAIIALTLYALLPIVRNTYAGLQEAPPAMLEMADALGLSRRQRLWMIEARFAMPFVLAGIRTATVVSVGIATLSAFIGAGGLGAFINRGLALNNIDIVLLGAVPAGLLALYMDFLLGAVEAWSKPGVARRPVLARLGIAALLAGVVFGGLATLRGQSAPLASGGGGTVIVGSKNFTEQLILGELLVQYIEAETDLTARRRLNLAGSAVCHEALLNGDIDLYVEYTGTALTSVLGSSAPPDPEEAYRLAEEEYLKRFNLIWLPRLGFANTYALAVRRADAEKHGWKTVSDLALAAGGLRAGFTFEFLEREDGYVGLRKAYGFEFGSAVDMDPGLMYEALRDGRIDVVSAFSTDGRIAAYDLFLLEDDRRFFPPYDAAIVVRKEALEKFPALGPALERLSGAIDEAAMQNLNDQVDGKKQLPRAVAGEFLPKLQTATP